MAKKVVLALYLRATLKLGLSFARSFGDCSVTANACSGRAVRLTGRLLAVGQERASAHLCRWASVVLPGVGVDRAWWGRYLVTTVIRRNGAEVHVLEVAVRQVLLLLVVCAAVGRRLRLWCSLCSSGWVRKRLGSLGRDVQGWRDGTVELFRMVPPDKLGVGVL